MGSEEGIDAGNGPPEFLNVLDAVVLTLRADMLNVMCISLSGIFDSCNNLSNFSHDLYYALFLGFIYSSSFFSARNMLLDQVNSLGSKWFLFSILSQAAPLPALNL